MGDVAGGGIVLLPGEARTIDIGGAKVERAPRAGAGGTTSPRRAAS